MNQSFTQYIGHPIAYMERAIRASFSGRVQIYSPEDVMTIPINMDQDRLQVFVDDQGIITRIVQG